jgi:hypothetical protein
MMRRTTTLAIAMMLVIGATQLSAHDNFRIIGTLMKHESSKIDVKKREGNTVTIMLDKQTQITRDKKKVAASELRAGQSLVVDAYGDTEDDSLAIEIRIVPPIQAGRN